MTNFEPSTLRRAPNELAAAEFSHTATRFPGSLWARWRQARRIARDTRLLEQIPDRLLKDMGLQRMGFPRRAITRLPDTLAKTEETRH